jgi:hypothetical protein
VTYGYLFVSLLYAVFGLAVFLFERRRTGRSGVDAITIFVVVFFLQCCVPGIVIYATLPFVDAAAPTGNDVFDRIFQATDLTTALLVLSMTVWFAVFFYVGCAVGRLALERAVTSRVPVFRLSVMDRRLLVLLVGGLALTVWSFYLMGDSLVARYTNLILLRADFEGVERNALNSNAFALTQSWSWLAFVALFAIRERRGRGALWLACLAFIMIFAVLGVSRRALFLPILLGYLTLVLYGGHWRFRWVLAGCIPLLLLVAFGKEIFAAVAWGGSVERVAGNYQSWASGLLRAMADMGITIVESLGTLKFLHMDLRYGTDHILSIAQRFPEGMLGLDLHFPERIVRISTAAFTDPNAQDIPPGLFGQMWLDFGVLGPLVWGLIFGLQMSVVQYFFERTERTRQSAAVFVLLTFVIALPLNSGSFDFTFSVDIFAVLLGLMWCVRLRRRPDRGAAARMPLVETAR